MPSTNATLVRSIVTQPRIPAGTDLSTYILTAETLVDELVPAGTYSDDRIKMIKTWLAAHFYVINAPRKNVVQALPARDEYDPIKVDLGLSVTKYGQQAKVLDTGNYLTPKVKMTVTWLGTDWET